MPVPQEMGSTYQAVVGSDNVRYITEPAGAVGIAAVSDGAAVAWAWMANYVQICAAAVIPNPCWLMGISFHTNAVESFYGEYVIASGAIGAEVDLAMFPVQSFLVGVTAQLIETMTGLPHYLPYPIRIAGSPRLALNLRKDTGASAAGGLLKVILATGIGV